MVGGEPAHGAAEVHTLEQVDSSAALQIDQRPFPSRPGAYGLRQGGEQDVVVPGVVISSSSSRVRDRSRPTLARRVETISSSPSRKSRGGGDASKKIKCKGKGRYMLRLLTCNAGSTIMTLGTFKKRLALLASEVSCYLQERAATRSRWNTRFVAPPRNAGFGGSASLPGSRDSESQIMALLSNN